MPERLGVLERVLIMDVEKINVPFSIVSFPGAAGLDRHTGRLLGRDGALFSVSKHSLCLIDVLP